MTISSKESENRLRLGYEMYFKSNISEENLISQHVHKACYKRVTRKLPTIKSEQKESRISLEGSPTTVNETSSIETDMNVSNNELIDRNEVI
jgi:hypothetical protein